MATSHLLRLGLIVFLGVIGGCAGTKIEPLQYIGNSNEIQDAPTPDGFAISPMEAERIRGLRTGPKKTIDDFYHDRENYYVCDGFNTWGRDRGSTDSTARRVGTVINGRTGEVYNRETGLWEPNPRLETASPQK